MKITVYSKPSCVQCNATYRQLDKQGTDYEKIDISQDPDARDFVAEGLGHQQAPVVVIFDEDGEVVEHWSGFKPDEIKALAL